MSEAIPKGWSHSKLGNVATLIMGQSPRSQSYNSEGVGLPFFQGKADFSQREAIVRNWCSEPIKTVGGGSILFSVRAPVGEINVAPEQCCIGRGLAAIKATKTDQEFLFQYLRHSKSAFDAVSQGSTFEAINGSELKEFILLCPPFPEQQKIATILSSVDDVIEKMRAQIDKLKDLKTGMMQELLTKGIGHIEFKDSPVGRIPEEWVTDGLDNLGTNHQPVLRTGPFGSSLKSEDFRISGIPVINIQNLGIGRLERDSVYFITKEKAQELGSYAVSKDDLVFSRVADVGRSVVIPDYAHGWIMSSNLMRISVDRTRIHPKYLMYQLVNGPAVTHQIKQVVADGGRPVITGSLLRSLIFPLPSIEEQFSIVQRIDSADEYLTKAEVTLCQLTSLKKALMQDLLTGKVRVKLDQPETTAA